MPPPPMADQVIQIVFEFVADLVSIRRLVAVGINPVQALINRNKWTAVYELCCYMMIGNMFLMVLPATTGWSRFQSKWCSDVDLSDTSCILNKFSS